MDQDLLPAPLRSVLYESANYRIEAIDFGQPGAVVVSFALYTHPGLNFAEGMLARYRQNGVFVTARGPHWYQYADSAAAADLLAAYCRRFERVVTFGVSMGGYAALAFSGAIEPTTVLAFSPQFSIDRAKVPFETRWGREAAIIGREDGFVYDRMEFSRRARIIVAYDPLDRDARHVALLRALGPIEEIPVPLSKHRTLKILAEMRVSSKLLLGATSGTLDLPGIRASIRNGRRDSITYLRHAAEALHARRLSGAGELLRRASARTPDDDLRNIRRTVRLAGEIGEESLAAAEFLRLLNIPKYYLRDDARVEFAAQLPAMLRLGLHRQAGRSLTLSAGAFGPRARTARQMRAKLRAALNAAASSASRGSDPVSQS